MVDDGSIGEFGKEIQLRSEIESFLAEKSNYKRCSVLKTSSEERHLNQNVPMVLVVVQGGLNTLETVFKAIFKRIPVLVLAVNKNLKINYLIIFQFEFNLGK